jgi:hypothetical protein
MQESARHLTRRRLGIGGAWVAINSLQHTRTLPFSDQAFEVFATALTIRIIGSLFQCTVLNPLDLRFIRRLTESFRLPVPVGSNYPAWVRSTFGGLETYGGGIFLPLKDATCGETSYGGGRYLLDTVKGADLGEEQGSLIVDLNFLYNPSCAYDARWVCPLPPAGNVLPVAIEAGEFGTQY